MRCESIFKDAVYTSALFCKTCGMDVGLDPVKRIQKGRKVLYCCEECAKNGQK